MEDVFETSKCPDGMVMITLEEYEGLKHEVRRLEKLVDVLAESNMLSQHKRFGASSEKGCYEQLSFLFNEAEVCADAADAEEDVEVKTHKRHKKHKYTLEHLPEGVPVEVIEHHLPAEEQLCPRCGSEMTEIGSETVRTLKIIPKKVYIQEDRYYSYACRVCNENGTETPVIKTPRNEPFISGSFASPEATAHIMVQKFVMGVPLYRQEQEFKRCDIDLSRQTMSNWLLRASEDYLSPIYEHLHRELLKRDILHADETTLQVLREKDRKPQTKSYMWLYRTSGDTDKPIVLYDYKPGRGREYPRKFLDGFKGYLHADGYEVYHDLLPDITVVGCMAHARRKFDEAIKSQPRGRAKAGPAVQGLAYCEQLFKIERDLSGLSAEERYKARLELEKPVLDALSAWADTVDAAPKSALGKALHYLREQWPYLTAYLEDGRLEISNNRAERSIKMFVIDRKNFLFANTPRGAEGSAVMFSLIETARENGLDPYKYLTYVFKTAPELKKQDPEWYEKLSPNNVKL